MNKLALYVDPGYAFDYFAILFVKLVKKPESEQCFSSFIETGDELLSQLGHDKFKEILFSREFNELFSINKEVYEMVDLAKKDQILASEVDDGNYRRFLAKRKLQERFFPNSKQVEQKIGYDNSKRN